MLILSRNIGQAIMIDDHVKIVILEVNGGQVRIGIEAPKEVAVHRKEIYERIQKEKAASLKNAEKA